MKQFHPASSPRPIPTAADFASLLFPQRCPLCDGVLPFFPRLRSPLPAPGQPDLWVHPSCLPERSREKGPLCFTCGRPLSGGEEEQCGRCREKGFHFLQNRSLWLYEEPFRSAMVRFKYHGRQQYAVFFARAWYGAFRTYLSQLDVQALIPVPIHRSRLRSRGYNQAALIAWELEKLSGIPCREDLILRIKQTGAQKDLGPQERLRNMENAFRLRKKPEGISRVLLVDDIFTTGSTLESISLVLWEAGIREIYAATLCMAGPEDSG
ncbi:MAG: ComF family protein [Lachnospiraceae bacterium]|nr:ComF family protein [Lachnospiraceae bacterium]